MVGNLAPLRQLTGLFHGSGGPERTKSPPERTESIFGLPVRALDTYGMDTIAHFCRLALPLADERVECGCAT